MVDMTGLRRTYKDYPNILAYIELLARRGAIERLDWIEKRAPADLARSGFTLDDIEEMLGYMMPGQTQEQKKEP